jgi:hypothetical protein
MRSYEVTFYRHLVNSTGDRFRSGLTTVQVNDCTSKREACESAIRRFEAAWALNGWRNLAHEYEVREHGTSRPRKNLAA